MPNMRNTSLNKEGKMSAEPSAAQKTLADFAPKLAELTDNVLFGDIWERPGLSKRDRSLITVAALIALYRPEQLRFHLNRAMDNGLSNNELIEVIIHLAFYSGWPTAMTAITVAKEVVAAREANQ
jgi:4-carboxymuconolactone decarboxylase